MSFFLNSTKIRTKPCFGWLKAVELDNFLIDIFCANFTMNLLSQEML